MLIFFLGIPLVAFLLMMLSGVACRNRFQREYGRRPLKKKTSIAETILIYLRLLVPLLNIILIFLAIFCFDIVYEKICEQDRELGGEQNV